MALDFSFQKRERLKKKNDFKRVYERGTFLRSRFYSCYYLKNNETFSRIGIVAKKRIGNAVFRNCEKRILREIFRLNKNLISSSYDFIFFVKSTPASFSEKQKSFVSIVKSIRGSL